MCIRRHSGDPQGVHADDEERSAADEATFRETNEQIRKVQSDRHAIVRMTGRAGTVAAEGDPREEDA